MSNLLERDGRHFTVRPEKIRLLGRTATQRRRRSHVEDGPDRGRRRTSACSTRYRVALEAAAQLIAVRQNLETAAADALEPADGPCDVAWRDDQTYEIMTTAGPRLARKG